MTKELRQNGLMGERLLKLRNQSGLTQEELAERLDVSRQSISKWELNKTLPDVDKLIQLSEMYQVTIDYLVTGREGKEFCEEEIKEEDKTIDEEEKNIDIHRDSAENNARRTILFVCMLLSGFLSLGVMIFAGRLLMNNTINRKNKKQDVVCVDKIYEQYTKAEISGSDFDKEMVWLDIPGVREGDFVFSYLDKENPASFTFDYYAKTLIIPAISGIVFLIFFIVFLMEWRFNGSESRQKIHERKGD